MKKFNFFKGIVPIEITPYNGVTDSYLIELNRDIWSYSDWIHSTMLTIDDESGLDSLIIEFTDIDNSDYWCEISSNGLIKMFIKILNERGEFEMLEPIIFSLERMFNTNSLINYLKSMPKTIASSL